jgi:hypothetical protein
MSTQMVIRLAEHGAEPEQLDQQSSSLRRELLCLDVDDVAMRRDGVPPEGSRAIDPIAVGQLLVTLQGSLEVVRPVVETVWAWVARRSEEKRHRTAELTVGGKTIKLSGVSVDQQDRLIEQFVLALTEK